MSEVAILPTTRDEAWRYADADWLAAAAWVPANAYKPSAGTTAGQQHAQLGPAT